MVVQTRGAVSSYQEMGKSRVRHVLVYNSHSHPCGDKLKLRIYYRYIV